MLRLASLALLILFSSLIMGSLPTVQSFKAGRVIINTPIILRAASTGPLEATRLGLATVAAARTPRLVSRLIRRLTTIAPQKLAAGTGEQVNGIPALRRLLPAPAPPPPSPEPLVVGVAAPPLPGTMEEDTHARNQPPSDPPAGVNPVLDDPAGSADNSRAERDDGEKNPDKKAGGGAGK
jgi:hypothetical protein